MPKRVSDPHSAVIHVDGYGDFDAHIRDFQSALAIEVKTDELISLKGVSPDTVSTTTRIAFGFLALFLITCDEVPKGFDIEEFQGDSPEKCFEFLTNYSKGLREAEVRFREGTKAPDENGLGKGSGAVHHKDEPVADKQRLVVDDLPGG